MIENELVSIFPEFEEYWRNESIYREKDGSFKPHGIMSSFFHFFTENCTNADTSKLKQLSKWIDKELKAGLKENSANADAICSCFLELVDSEKLDKYLEKTCSEYIKLWWQS